MSLIKILPGSSIAAIDERCIIDGIDSKELMKNAGTSISDAVMEENADIKKKGLVLAGGGNNGGDGFVCALALMEKGYEVSRLSPQ
jgi:ADP-dependent NAD(P)H-hydrate dehydratase / NAD(P)H-hydrate epimerase